MDLILNRISFETADTPPRLVVSAGIRGESREDDLVFEAVLCVDQPNWKQLSISEIESLTVKQLKRNLELAKTID